MIFDMRTYKYRPGTLPALVKLYGEHGLGPQSRHLGPPVVWGTTDVGALNTYVHIWAYDDMADRAAKREALWADPEWLAPVAKSREHGGLLEQENQILVAPPFFELKR